MQKGMCGKYGLKTQCVGDRKIMGGGRRKECGRRNVEKGGLVRENRDSRSECMNDRAKRSVHGSSIRKVLLRNRRGTLRM